MSKGLEALEKIKPFLEIIDGEDGVCWGTGEYEEQEALETIEKDLEVLEIIKKKRVDMDCLISCIKYEKDGRVPSAFIYYNDCCVEECKLTETEFNLIKEWLER